MEVLRCYAEQYVDDRSNTDSIALRWGRLLDTAEQAGKTVRRLSFSHLRKTASTFILNVSGSENIQQMMLCHAPRSIAGRHYTGRRDVQPLQETLGKFRQLLVDARVLPAGGATVPPRASVACLDETQAVGDAEYVFDDAENIRAGRGRLKDQIEGLGTSRRMQ